jgi:hypothetical protein
MTGNTGIYLKEIGYEDKTEQTDSGEGPMAGSYEYNNGKSESSEATGKVTQRKALQIYEHSLCTITTGCP